MRILVTGGAGYVGGFCARHLVAQGHDVVVLDNLSEGHRQAAPQGSLVEGDISNRALLEQILSDHGVEAVMHFAASCYVGESMTNPRAYYRNNVANTLELLETLIDCDVRRIVFSSTCAVHGETAQMPLTEQSPVAPASTYAFTKHAIEQMIRDFSRAYGLSFVLLRYFNAAGADPSGAFGEDHEPETHLIPIVLQAALGKRDSLQVFGNDYDTPDGTCIRDYIHVADLADAHERAITRMPGAGAEPRGDLFNLGTGTGTSVLEVIQAAERITGRDLPYTLQPRRPGDTARLVAGSDLAASELGWELGFPGIDEIVRTAWAWHQNHPDGYGPA